MDKNKSILTHLIGNCALYGFRWFGTDDEKWFFVEKLELRKTRNIWG